jgi:hypothetical protein
VRQVEAHLLQVAGLDIPLEINAVHHRAALFLIPLSKASHQAV